MNLTDFLGDMSPSARGFEAERILGPGVRAGEGPVGGGGRILCRMLVVSGESERRRPPIAGSGVAGVPMARDARRLGALPSARERIGTEEIEWAGVVAEHSSRLEGDVGPCTWVGWFSFSGERLRRGCGDAGCAEGFGLEEKVKGRGDGDRRLGVRAGGGKDSMFHGSGVTLPRGDGVGGTASSLSGWSPIANNSAVSGAPNTDCSSPKTGLESGISTSIESVPSWSRKSIRAGLIDDRRRLIERGVVPSGVAVTRKSVGVEPK